MLSNKDSQLLKNKEEEMQRRQQGKEQPKKLDDKQIYNELRR